MTVDAVLPLACLLLVVLAVIVTVRGAGSPRRRSRGYHSSSYVGSTGDSGSSSWDGGSGSDSGGFGGGDCGGGFSGGDGGGGGSC
ncbi:hypothetical protein [Saccharopolyspora thermophila]|uniref:Uncharacterized protein n=1 Tax=Saccharopolyspora thermophila TaxID=89367 RepID=A0ABN1DCC1_9PSEU